MEIVKTRERGGGDQYIYNLSLQVEMKETC
jgi:hypothetical protein